MNIHSMTRLMTKHKPKGFTLQAAPHNLDLAGVRVAQSARHGIDAYFHSFPSCCGVAVLHCLPEDGFGPRSRLDRFRRVVETAKKAARAEGTSLLLAVTSAQDQATTGEILAKADFERVVTQHNPKSGGEFILWMCNLFPNNEQDYGADL